MKLLISLDFFEHVVHADLVKKSKPHPETFLTAAALVNVEPSSCLIFEDAPVGVRAAEAAGIDSVVILTTHEKEEFSDFKKIQTFITDYESVIIEQ